MGLKAIGILLLILALQSGAFYLYHKYSSARIDAAELKADAAEQKAKGIEESFKGFKEDFERSTQLFEGLNSDNNAIRSEMSRIRQSIRNLDIDGIGQTNPGQVDTQINTSTLETFSKLKEVTQPDWRFKNDIVE